jgi:ABC-type lipoprotein release transport system permease subunit
MPPIQEGRAPRTADEIVLGPKTLRRIHKTVGDTVSVSVVGITPKTMRIVGRAVVPTVGHTANLGEGAVVTFDGLGYFFGRSDEGRHNDEFGVRFKAGIDGERAVRRLQALLTPYQAQVAPPTTPGDLVNFGRSKNLPFILSGLLALLALATLAHALVTSINRRRRDLAICKTLGFTRGEVARTLAWQSSTFILVALILGLFIGVVGGRWLWTVYAGQLGVLAAPRVPAGTLAIVAVASALLANVLALLPGRSAARTRPALVLRSE